MVKSTISSEPFIRSSLPPDTKIFRPRISFRLKATYIDNKYELYYKTCAYVSSMLEGVNFTVSYAPVAGILSLCIIVDITSAEGLIIFVLVISNAFQNTILLNPEERVYLSLPLYLECFKRKLSKHPLSSINQKKLCIQAIKSTQGKNCWKIMVRLNENIITTVKMTRSSSDNAVFLRVYKIINPFLRLIYILSSWQHIIGFALKY